MPKSVAGYPGCAQCRRPIVIKYLPYRGDKYHPSCIKCSKCDKGMTEAFSVHGNKPRCQVCFPLKLDDPCFRCKLPIKESGIITGDKYWHEKCMICTACNKQIVANSLEPILAIEHLVYHWECLRCSFCSRVLDEDLNYKDFKPYCAFCFQDQFSPRCHICGVTIDEDVIVADGKKLHRRCYKCIVCHNAFDDEDEYYAYDNHFYCLRCYKKKYKKDLKTWKRNRLYKEQQEKPAASSSYFSMLRGGKSGSQTSSDNPELIDLGPDTPTASSDTFDKEGNPQLS